MAQIRGLPGGFLKFGAGLDLLSDSVLGMNQDRDCCNEKQNEPAVHKTPNSTHGSGWIVQMVSTRNLKSRPWNPTNGVGGWFKFFLVQDLKYAPTVVGGITLSSGGPVERI